jgi:hypothetical protein
MRLEYSMSNSSYLRRVVLSGFFASAGAMALLFPGQLHGQGIARNALSSFPAGTHQFVYTNLEQLRDSAQYPKIRQRLFGGPLRGFADFLRSARVDPEKDVDEVVLGWRGPATGNIDFFGLANGHFDPEHVRQFFTQRGLPTSDYGGLHLYAPASGKGDLWFTFLGSSSAAFGRMGDLKALLDVRAGTSPALDSNPQFLSWEGELEGSAPQWGVATGRAATNEAARWLAGGLKAPADLGALMGPVQAVLYSIDLSEQFSARISVVCDRPETAAALAQILTLWRSSPAAAGNSSANLSAFLQGLALGANGSRVELSGSGPVELLDELGP